MLFHLGLATLSIVVLVAVAIGWREGGVVAIVIPVTILLTLFASWLMGYTINRVSLFALIFSIGILVDDAIVVIENIARHWAHARRSKPNRSGYSSRGRSRQSDHRRDVDRCRSPSADAVRLGADGAVHEPHSGERFSGNGPVVLRRHDHYTLADDALRQGRRALTHTAAHGEVGLHDIYLAVARPILATKRTAWTFLLAVGLATLASVMLLVVKAVTVKLLPFDDKSELQVVIDLPAGSSLEETDRVLSAAADRLKDLPELTSIQAYVGHGRSIQFQRPRATLLSAQ